jgi:prepilin-type processing-associated H-X9-DG protein/prepilin-type N-terminal cleavage/methylation domain-containing protein
MATAGRGDPVERNTGSSGLASASQAHRGLTIVEFLTVISVIGLLASIALPGVMAVRARAHRLQCAHRLGQLAIAVELYSNQHNVLPALATSGGECGSIGEGVFTRLFPYLELPPRCRAIQSESLRFPVLICPSDEQTDHVSAPLSFRANISPGINSGYAGMGPFRYFFEDAVRHADCTDGLSTSAVFAEQVVGYAGGHEALARQRPERYVWSVVVDPLSSFALENPFSTHAALERQAQTETSLIDCVGHHRFFQSRAEATAADWRHTNSGLVAYSHLFTPNSPNCTSSGVGEEPFIGLNHGTASAHQGGVNVAFLDGHVRFVSESVDPIPWRAAGTVNGGETAALEDH